MKDEERQALTFEGKYNNFLVSLVVSPESESFNIKAENTITLDIYTRAIDKKFISERQNLDCFRDPTDIFDFLTEQFKNVVVEDGTIKFLFVWGKVMKKERPISIELEKQENDEVKIERLSKQLLQREGRIKELEQKLKQKDATIRELLNSLKEKDEENEKSEKTIQRLKSQLKQIGKEQSPLKITPKYTECLIAHHPDNPLQEQYSLKILSLSSAKLTSLKMKGWYNFVASQIAISLDFLDFQQNINCRLKSEIGTQRQIFDMAQQTKLKYFHQKERTPQIMVGFCTAKCLGNRDNYTHPQSVYYHIWATFYLEGVGTGNCESSGNGDLVEVEADLKQDILRWSKNTKLIKECKVPAKLKGKPIYFSILTGKDNSEIDISVLA